MAYRAVIFDLGGVVLGSPLHAIARYERHLGIPENFINQVVVDTAPHGAWSRLERGEIALVDFFPAFERDCQAAGHRISASTMMEWMAREALPRPAMLTAIRQIRARGLAVAALTNNWAGADGGDDQAGLADGTRLLHPAFDVVVESSVEGLRKPDPRIYQLTCERLGVTPAEAIFLDDIGRNLKPARQLGLATIKVTTPESALAELEQLLGFPLSD